MVEGLGAPLPLHDAALSARTVLYHRYNFRENLHLGAILVVMAGKWLLAGPPHPGQLRFGDGWP